jgi:hypothetical protein
MDRLPSSKASPVITAQEKEPPAAAFSQLPTPKNVTEIILQLDKKRIGVFFSERFKLRLIQKFRKEVLDYRKPGPLCRPLI